jgi:hypothetical protein
MNAQPHNAIPYVIDATTRETAKYINNVTQLHRMQLNDRDKERQAAANEREIARLIEDTP